MSPSVEYLSSSVPLGIRMVRIIPPREFFGYLGSFAMNQLSHKEISFQESLVKNFHFLVKVCSNLVANVEELSFKVVAVASQKKEQSARLHRGAATVPYL